MPIQLVQSATGTTGNYDSTTLAFGTNVVAGNLLVCMGAVWNGTQISSITITDTIGTSYTVVLGASSGDLPNKTWIAYGIAPSSGANTVTIDPNGGGRYSSHCVAEFSGVHTSAPLDADGGSATGSGTTASDSVTTVDANTLVLGVMSHGSGGNHALTEDTAGGWMLLQENENAGNAPYAAAYQIFTSTGAKTASWTIAASVSWAAQTCAFKQAATAPPFTVRQSTLRGGDVLRGETPAGGVTDADGSASGSGTASGTTAALDAGVGSSGGGSTATGSGAAVDTGVGSATGSGTATGQAAAVLGGDGAASGVATAGGAAATVVGSDGASAGSSGVSGAAANVVGADGSSAGTATVSGDAADAGSGGSTATASGTATVTGSAANVVGAEGTSAGSSGVSGAAATVVGSEGASAGSSAAAGAGGTVHSAEGSASGQSSADAVAAAIREAEAIAAGAAGVSASASVVTPATGSSAGVASVLGVPVVDATGEGVLSITVLVAPCVDVEGVVTDSVLELARVSPALALRADASAEIAVDRSVNPAIELVALV